MHTVHYLLLSCSDRLFVFVYRHVILVPNLSTGRIGKQFYPMQEKTTFWEDGKDCVGLGNTYFL